jgi:hypothetical protein
LPSALLLFLVIANVYVVGHLRSSSQQIDGKVRRMLRRHRKRNQLAGFKYDLLLARIQQDLATRVTFVTRKFLDLTELAALKEKVIVNCTGFGSGALFQDSLMKPLKGETRFSKAAAEPQVPL